MISHRPDRDCQWPAGQAGAMAGNSCGHGLGEAAQSLCIQAMAASAPRNGPGTAKSHMILYLHDDATAAAYET